MNKVIKIILIVGILACATYLIYAFVILPVYFSGTYDEECLDVIADGFCDESGFSQDGVVKYSKFRCSGEDELSKKYSFSEQDMESCRK